MAKGSSKGGSKGGRGSTLKGTKTGKIPQQTSNPTGRPAKGR